MLQARISVPLLPFSEDVKTAIPLAAGCGAEGIQLDLRQQFSQREFGDTARRQVLHLMQENGLAVASGTFPLRSPLAAAERLDERLQALQQAMQLLAQFKGRSLTLRVGRVPARDDEPAERDTLITILNDLASTGNHLGVVLMLLPSGDDSAEMLSLISEVRSGPVQVAADPAGWLLHGQNPAQQLRSLHAVIGHVEVRDAVRDVDGSGREVPVGRGELDWDELAALFDEIGYHGWFHVNRTVGEQRAQDIRRAVSYLRQLFPGSTQS